MANEIRHSFFIDAPVDTVMSALMSEAHIQQWWTKEAQIVDGKGQFGWSSFGWRVELEMVQDTDTRQVVWKCTSSNMQNTSAWVGTTITFALISEKTGTRLNFAQTDYQTSPCFAACDQGWAYFVGISLKQYLETGKGIPYPEMLNTNTA
jgi:uncharacterized protein YndB with AHSA1/START domain